MSTARPGSIASASGTPDSVYVDPYEPEYPQDDGNPMAESTLQYQWIVTIKEGLEVLFADRDDVFVAADLLWYATRGDKHDVVAPDVLVVFGRPKGHRRSYREWVEGGVVPQVVFEVASHTNTAAEMARKLALYDRRGVEEYYYYDPESGELEGWIRQGDRLAPAPDVEDWTSPRLGISFEAPPGRDLLVVRGPDGRRFLTFAEQAREADASERRARKETRLRRQAERDARDERRLREEAESQTRAAIERAERMASRLRELGLEAE